MQRLDTEMARRGLALSREKARGLIMAGRVRVNSRPAAKPDLRVDSTTSIAVVGAVAEYASRGAYKLLAAVDHFAIDVTGRLALDVGASTGGFTHCRLEHGARRVYAVDVGHGQLAWTLRNDPRVVVMEHTNIRHLTSLPEPIQCVVIDVSFISLRLVLPAIIPLLAPEAWIVALVKPQFEAGKAEVDRGSGVIRDPAVHTRVVEELQAWIAEKTPLQVRSVTDSPIYGREGNREFLFYLGLSTAVD